MRSFTHPLNNVIWISIALSLTLSCDGVGDFILEDLFNAALIYICEHFTKMLQLKTSNIDDPKELLLQVMKGYIEYAVEYPGRLNFFHFERLNMSFSAEAGSSAQIVGYNMAGYLKQCVGEEIEYNKIVEINSILYRYLLGDLSEYITGRVKIEYREDFINEKLLMCKKLFDVLLGQARQKGEAYEV